MSSGSLFFSSYSLSYASRASSRESYDLEAKNRRLRSYLLMTSLRLGGTTSFEEKPSPTFPLFVGLSRLVSSGGGGVNEGKAITGASSSTVSGPSPSPTPYFL